MDITTNRLHLGAAYYPEHWPESRWGKDIDLMREVGLSVVRLAEFAWSSLEPDEGQFRLDWLERAVARLASAGIASVLGTPTAAPPPWLVSKHPDLLAVDENGRRVQIGNRCHYCVNSPEFHEATRRIVTAMAKCFGRDSNVIGWQIDNEYNRVCHCDRCRSLFQRYLETKYGSLDALNERWSTRYWSQTYSAWAQIPIPIGPHNPGLLLEFKRFVSSSYRRFQRLQVDALRPHLHAQAWITHNFMNWYDGFDHYDVAGDLDLASWDWYVGTGHYDHIQSGAAHDLIRGLKRQNFWLIETQPGNVNWSTINNVLDRGEARAMAWHSVAHGADAVLYWQWRSALGGQEQYHGTLVDQSGQPRPFFQEARQLGAEFRAASPLLADSKISAEVALLNSYDSRWSIQWQPHHRDFDHVAHLLHYYRPLAARSIGVDILSADSALDGFKLAIAPALLILDEKRVENLKRFVEKGGHLVLTIRTGMKDADNALLPMRQPGPLAELAGVEVEEYYALDAPAPVRGESFQGQTRLWAERLKVLDPANTQVLATFGPSNGWLDGHPAVTMHAYGKGRVYFLGAYLDDDSQWILLSRIASQAGVDPVIETPNGVTAQRRVKKDGKEIFIVVNHTPAEQQVGLPWRAQEHLSEQAIGPELVLAPFGVAVLTH